MNLNHPKATFVISDKRGFFLFMVLFSIHHPTCALCPTAKRACDRAWVTAKNLEEWSGMTKGTLRNRLIELEECERISRGQDFNHVDIPTETGVAS